MKRKLLKKNTNWLLLVLSILFISCTTDSNEPQDAQLVSKKEKITVVIIGSSIASGVGASTYINSWAGLLQAATKDNIINNAVSGYTTFHFLPNTILNTGIETDVKRNITASLKLNPDLIIFSITTNDIAMGFTVDQYMANMKVMTNLCEANHVFFLVGSTSPRALDSGGMKALIEINTRLKTTYGDKFVEYYTELTNSDTFKIKSIYDSGDGLHPSNAGHKVIFDAFYPVYVKMKNKILEN